jgi:tetratricopeptide (TPR) repeat protein
MTASFRLKQWPKALEYYNQALPLHRPESDHRWEGQTLTSLGKAIAALGDAEKALDYYAQALSIHRAVWNLSAEAETLHGMPKSSATAGTSAKPAPASKRRLTLSNHSASKWRAKNCALLIWPRCAGITNSTPTC